MESSHKVASSQQHIFIKQEGGQPVLHIDETNTKKVEWQKADCCALFYKIMVATSAVLVVLGLLALTSALLPNAASIAFISSVAHSTSVVAGVFSTTSLNLAIFTLSLAGGLAIGGGFGWAYNAFKSSENRRLGFDEKNDEKKPEVGEKNKSKESSKNSSDSSKISDDESQKGSGSKNGSNKA